MPPLISVCMSVSDAESCVAETIESVLAQTLSDFELIIVDDASQDGTTQIVESYRRKHSHRIQILRTERRIGSFESYNLAMSRAAAGIIKPLGCRDVLLPSMLEQVRSVLVQHPAVALVSTARRWLDQSSRRDITTESGITSGADFVAGNSVVEAEEVIKLALFRLDNFIGEPSTVAFRTSALVGGGFDPSFHQLSDLELWLRILNEGQYYFLDQHLCDCLVAPQSEQLADRKLLLHAVDFLRLGVVYEQVIRSVGKSKQDYARHVVSLLGHHFYRLSEKSNLEQELCSTNSPPRAAGARERPLDDEDVRLLQQITGFALLEMERLSRKYEQGSTTHASSHAQIKFLERRLRDLLRSPSWRSTAWLRGWKLLLLRGNFSKVPAARKGLDRNRQRLNTADGYSQFLRRNIVRIRRSLSWRLTRPLRALEFRLSDRQLSAPQAANSYRTELQEVSLVSDFGRGFECELALAAVIDPAQSKTKSSVATWMRFHKQRGVGRFYLFLNDQNQRQRELWQAELSESIASGEVCLLELDVNLAAATQTSLKAAAYREALTVARGRVKWLGFIDADELLTPMQANDLRPLLSAYEKFGAVCINRQRVPDLDWDGQTSLDLAYVVKKAEARSAASGKYRTKPIVRPDRTLDFVDDEVLCFSNDYFQVNEDRIAFVGAIAPYFAKERLLVVASGNSLSV